MEDDNQPELEFDDSGLDLAPSEAPQVPVDILFEEDVEENDPSGLLPYNNVEEFISKSRLADDDYEAALGVDRSRIDQEDDSIKKNDFSDIAEYKLIEVAGDGQFGLKVVIFFACRLPNSSQLDHRRLLPYMKSLLDDIVESDYLLVYFHHGLSSSNKPPFSFFKDAYRELDRRYKKNLKYLCIVHPTTFVKVVLGFMRPFVSSKFSKKIIHINYLQELAAYLHIDQLRLIIPETIKSYDAKLVQKFKPPQLVRTVNSQRTLIADVNPAELPLTWQFGVSLKVLGERSQCVIPLVLEKCVSHIMEKGLNTQGVLRRSVAATTVKRVQQLFNEGKEVDFNLEGSNGDASDSSVHLAAVILKTFLRELPEPILTFALYAQIMKSQVINASPESCLDDAQYILNHLPEENYHVVKYLMKFLAAVADHSNTNMMNVENLSIVIGPNLLWSNTEPPTITSIQTINKFCQLLIGHYDHLFEL